MKRKTSHWIVLAFFGLAAVATAAVAPRYSADTPHEKKPAGEKVTLEYRPNSFLLDNENHGKLDQFLSTAKSLPGSTIEAKVYHYIAENADAHRTLVDARIRSLRQSIEGEGIAKDRLKFNIEKTKRSRHENRVELEVD